MLKEIAASGLHAAGFKASGGIRTVADAAPYLELAAQLLGPEQVTPHRFRFGASGLLNDIEAVLSGTTAAPTKAGYRDAGPGDHPHQARRPRR